MFLFWTNRVIRESTHHLSASRLITTENLELAAIIFSEESTAIFTPDATECLLKYLAGPHFTAQWWNNFRNTAFWLKLVGYSPWKCNESTNCELCTVWMKFISVCQDWLLSFPQMSKHISLLQCHFGKERSVRLRWMTYPCTDVANCHMPDSVCYGTLWHRVAKNPPAWDKHRMLFLDRHQSTRSGCLFRKTETWWSFNPPRIQWVLTNPNSVHDF